MEARIFSQRVNGLLVETEQPAELAQALQQLISDTELAKRLALAGRTTVLRDYQLAHITDQFIRFYRQTLTDEDQVKTKVLEIVEKNNMEKKPRICVAISTFYPLVGGAETQTLAQCQRLIETGYPTRVITFRHKQIWSPYDKVNGVPIRRVAGVLIGKREKLPRIVQRSLYFLAMLVMAITIWRERNNFDILQVCQFSLTRLAISTHLLYRQKANDNCCHQCWRRETFKNKRGS